MYFITEREFLKLKDFYNVWYDTTNKQPGNQDVLYDKPIKKEELWNLRIR